MRVIAGTAKGRRLYAPKGMETRPITAKIKVPPDKKTSWGKRETV